MFSKDIYIFRRGLKGTVMWYPTGEKEIDPGTYDTPPSVRMDTSIFKLLVQATGPEYKSPEKPFLEGKVEAQSEHLKDLRKLLKL